MTEKDSSEACVIASQNCAVYSVFPSGTTSHSKISQFNGECTGRFNMTELSGPTGSEFLYKLVGVLYHYYRCVGRKYHSYYSNLQGIEMVHGELK